MLNVGGGEFLVILLVALIVLGPTKLPEVARQVGGVARELRRMSAGFQDELKNALDDPIEEDARERGRKVVSSEQQPAPAADVASGDGDAQHSDPADEVEDERSISTAEAAGMYDVANRASAAKQANREAVNAAKASERARAATATEAGQAADRERDAVQPSQPDEPAPTTKPTAAPSDPAPDLDLDDTEAQA